MNVTQALESQKVPLQVGDKVAKALPALGALLAAVVGSNSKIAGYLRTAGRIRPAFTAALLAMDGMSIYSNGLKGNALDQAVSAGTVLMRIFNLSEASLKLASLRFLHPLLDKAADGSAFVATSAQVATRLLRSVKAGQKVAAGEDDGLELTSHLYALAAIAITKLPVPQAFKILAPTAVVMGTGMELWLLARGQNEPKREPNHGDV